jgi:hypothetical protein
MVTHLMGSVVIGSEEGKILSGHLNTSILLPDVLNHNIQGLSI